MYFQKKTFTLNTFAFTSINLHADDDIVSFTNPLAAYFSSEAGNQSNDDDAGHDNGGDDDSDDGDTIQH